MAEYVLQPPQTGTDAAFSVTIDLTPRGHAQSANKTVEIVRFFLCVFFYARTQ